MMNLPNHLTIHAPLLGPLEDSLHVTSVILFPSLCFIEKAEVQIALEVADLFNDRLPLGKGLGEVLEEG